MGVRFIYGRSGTGKSYTCIEEIYQKAMAKVNYPLILLVPEQLSFRAEKSLIQRIGATGINNVHVLSFKRLAFTVFNEVGGITRKHMDSTGKVMVINKILNEIRDDLSIFGQVSKQRGFVDTVSEVITEMKRHNVTPETLSDLKDKVSDNPLLVHKLTDIALIYGSFQNKLNEGYFDPEDDLSILYEKIEESEFLKGSEIWIDEFSGFTPQQYNIIGKLFKLCKEVNITLPYSGREVVSKEDVTNPFYPIFTTESIITKVAQDYGYYPKNNTYLKINHRFKDSVELGFLEKNYFNVGIKPYEGATEDIKIFKAQNAYGEMEYIAKDILRLVREQGLRFNDISVVTRDLESYEEITRVIFNEYEIPHFIDKKKDISGNPLVIYITSLLEIFTKNWSDVAVLRYIKSGFNSLCANEVDFLENYVLQYGIKSRKRWLEDSYWKENEKYPNILEIRDKVITPIINLQKSLKGKKTVRETATSVYNFLTQCNIYERIQGYIEVFNKEGNLLLVEEYSAIWNLIMELLNQMVEVLGEEVVTLEEFNSIFSTGIMEHQMGLIPPALDGVIVGSAERIRTHEIKALYVVGVNDGVFPRASNDEGLFNDSDRFAFAANNVSVADNTLQQAFAEQFLIYNTLTLPSEYLCISYPIADSEGRAKRYSMIIPRVKSTFKNIKEESNIIEKSSGDVNYEDIVSKIPTFNRLITEVRRYMEEDKIHPIWSEAYKYFMDQREYEDLGKKIFSGFTYDNTVEQIKKEKIRELYGNSFSVSKIERYAHCPFAYFVEYGLRARERKIYTFAPPDLGNFLHNGLEKFSEIVEKEGETWGALEEEFCKEAIEQVVEYLISMDENSILVSSKRHEYVIKRLTRVLLRMVLIIDEQMERGSFKPLGYEISFGSRADDDYPPIEIILSSGEKLTLEGKIDRVDKAEIDGINYYRVVDYKSGNTELKLNEVYTGLQIQLLTYLDAILTLEKTLNKENTNPAAMLYLSIDDPLIQPKKELSEEALKEEMLKSLKMHGLIIKDLKVVKEMDKTIEEGGASSVIPVTLKKAKKGEDEPEFSDRGTSVITYEGFKVLKRHMKENVVKICEDMLSGIIDIEPCKKTNSTQCDYCSYLSICQFDNTLGLNKYNTQRTKNKKEVLALIEEEAKGEGDERSGE
ncbi:helicase-exonuclease AddAB subunit AddB [Clostridium sp.]|uniref:helicase-exonuclease AddAB subunit AddB n=1 Tax=Clostridium sp. TaxID=1506 RepID=UPI002FC5C155